MEIRSVNLTSLIRQDSHLDSKKSEAVAPLSFEKVLGQALGEVNDLQQQAATANTKLLSGQLEYVHQATSLAEKASLALELTLQIRNKALEAFQEIMRTQI